MNIVKYDNFGFFGNLYLTIVFNIYKIVDNRKSSSDITFIENANITIEHTFGLGKIIITDR